MPIQPKLQRTTCRKARVVTGMAKRLCRGLWIRRRSTTSQQRNGAPACYRSQEDQ